MNIKLQGVYQIKWATRGGKSLMDQRDARTGV